MPAERITLLGGGPLDFHRDADALRVSLPGSGPGAIVPVLRID